MSERWIPLAAAVIGLLGGMAGAYIGGSVANEGQQQRFENEQTAETRDLRIETYANLLKACESAYSIPAAQPGEEPLTRIQVNERVAELTAAQGRAALVTSSTEVQEAADELGPNELGCGDVSESEHQAAKESFIDAARPEITGD